jgi:rare lipoprotein A
VRGVRTRMGDTTGRIGMVVLAAGVLAACGTTKPMRVQAPVVAPPAPQAESPPPTLAVPVPNPVYKVGNPYQVAGIWYYPQEQPDYDETGIASWYGMEFHGRVTANGEVFDRTGISAAHPTLPMPVNVRVTNLENGRSIVVRVNDRGPFVNGRIIDMSEHAADLLGFRIKGTARVRVTFLSRADLYGPGAAPPSQETLPEVANAVPAAPTAVIAAADLPPVAGARVAAPRPVATLPKPIEQVTTAALPEIPDGRVTEVPVPSATAIYVQAGAFTSVTNAGSVAARLYNLGARVFPGSKDGHAIYRVRIGPFQNVGDADTALARVQALGHNDVQIVVDPATS